MVHYPITAALKAGIFETVMVSTDSEEISKISRDAGASVPFLRSAKAADDYATLAEVVKEVLAEYKAIGQEFDFFCVVLPTNPFIRPEVLVKAYQALSQNLKADSAMPVVEFEYPIQRALKKTMDIDGAEYVQMLWPEYIETRSQDCAARYHDCGQFYWMKVDYFESKQPKWLIGDRTVPIEIPASEVQDIDTMEHWKLAEIKYAYMHRDLLSGVLRVDLPLSSSALQHNTGRAVDDDIAGGSFEDRYQRAFGPGRPSGTNINLKASFEKREYERSLSPPSLTIPEQRSPQTQKRLDDERRKRFEDIYSPHYSPVRTPNSRPDGHKNMGKALPSRYFDGTHSHIG